jgi:hypothetical protein
VPRRGVKRPAEGYVSSTSSAYSGDDDGDASDPSVDLKTAEKQLQRLRAHLAAEELKVKRKRKRSLRKNCWWKLRRPVMTSEEYKVHLGIYAASFDELVQSVDEEWRRSSEREGWQRVSCEEAVAMTLFLRRGRLVSNPDFNMGGLFFARSPQRAEKVVTRMSELLKRHTGKDMGKMIWAIQKKERDEEEAYD